MLSVGGSLVTYLLKQESELTYSAVFRPTNGTRTDIPIQVLLEKKGDAWQAHPWDDEIVKGLVGAIEVKTAEQL